MSAAATTGPELRRRGGGASSASGALSPRSVAASKPTSFPMLPNVYGHHKGGLAGVATPIARRVLYLGGFSNEAAYQPEMQKAAQAWVNQNFEALKAAYSDASSDTDIPVKSPNNYTAYSSLPQNIIEIIKGKGSDDDKKARIVDSLKAESMQVTNWLSVFIEAKKEFQKSFGCTLFTYLLLDNLFSQINNYHPIARSFARSILAGTVKGYINTAFAIDIIAEFLVETVNWTILKPLAYSMPFLSPLITSAAFKTAFKSVARLVIFKMHTGNGDHLDNFRDLLIESFKGCLKGGTRDTYVALCGTAAFSMEAYFCPTFMVTLIALFWSQTLV